jgi:hypothetical protein
MLLRLMPVQISTLSKTSAHVNYTSKLVQNTNPTLEFVMTKVAAFTERDLVAGPSIQISSPFQTLLVTRLLKPCTSYLSPLSKACCLQKSIQVKKGYNVTKTGVCSDFTL